MLVFRSTQVVSGMVLRREALTGSSSRYGFAFSKGSSHVLGPSFAERKLRVNTAWECGEWFSAGVCTYLHYRNLILNNRPLTIKRREDNVCPHFGVHEWLQLHSFIPVVAFAFLSILYAVSYSIAVVPFPVMATCCSCLTGTMMIVRLLGLGMLLLGLFVPDCRQAP